MAIIRGTSASNILRGTAGADTIYGNGGNDTLYGGAGNDTLIGGTGNDSIHGGDGNDWVKAVAGDGLDHIYGDKGRDYIELTAGDVIHYSSYQQSGPDFGIDSVHPLHAQDAWTINFSGFDANLLMAGQQQLSWGTGIGQIHVIYGGLFGIMPIGLGANLDNDPALEFQINFTWEFEVTPTLIF
jgi:serralysin